MHVLKEMMYVTSSHISLQGVDPFVRDNPSLSLIFLSLSLTLFLSFSCQLPFSRFLRYPRPFTPQGRMLTKKVGPKTS